MSRTSQMAVAAVLALAAGWVPQAGAQADYAGLWLGNATLYAVSDANPMVSDLSFDLLLEGVLIEEKLVSLGSTWRYNDTGAALNANWRLAAYPDATWPVGPAEFGYGDGDEATTNSYGAVATNKIITTYFRQFFTVADPNGYSSLRIRLKRDDGAVVYLNGNQVLRSNVPAIYDYQTLALSAVEGSAETNFVEVTLPGNLLLATNLVAVEVHLASRDDDDMSFDLEIMGTAVGSPRTTLIPIHADWKYTVPQMDLGTAWRATGFDDAAWSAGVGQFGYGDGDEDTLIGFGDATNKNKTTYFRRAFLVNDPADFSHLDIYLMRDDGAAVYLNGEEVLRSNLPESGEVDYDTAPLLPITSTNEFQYQHVQVSSGGLVAGTNVLAVSIHQHGNELGEMSVGSPTFTPAAMDLRLMVHAASNGTVRLLKDVIQMWKEGTYAPAADGTNIVIAVPGHFVLLTDDSLIEGYRGVGLKDGTPVGRRMSAVGFDFEGTSLEMAGAVGPAGYLVVTNVIPPGFRTNPFRHKYHPDHDNLDARYSGYLQEAPEITRVIGLYFSTRYPPDPLVAEQTPPPGWGATVLGGTYYEVLTGLHKNPVHVMGHFEMQRVTVVGALNDE